jgi:hypothetical protein
MRCNEKFREFDLPCYDYGYGDFFETYWSALATNDLPAATPGDAFGRLLVWFRANVDSTLVPAGKVGGISAAWHKLLEKHWNDNVFTQHDWSAKSLSALSQVVTPLCTHVADFRAGTVAAVSALAELKGIGVPKCEGAVICGALQLPPDYGKDTAAFQALLKQASSKGPIVVVTTKPPHNDWKAIAQPVDIFGPAVPELVAWYTQIATAHGAPKIKAIPGGYRGYSNPLLLNSISTAPPRHTLLVTFTGDATGRTRAAISFCAREHWPFATVLPGGLIAQVLKPIAKNTTAVSLSMLNLCVSNPSRLFFTAHAYVDALPSPHGWLVDITMMHAL